MENHEVCGDLWGSVCNTSLQDMDLWTPMSNGLVRRNNNIHHKTLVTCFFKTLAK